MVFHEPHISIGTYCLNEMSTSQYLVRSQILSPTPKFFHSFRFSYLFIDYSLWILTPEKGPQIQTTMFTYVSLSSRISSRKFMVDETSFLRNYCAQSVRKWHQ